MAKESAKIVAKREHDESVSHTKAELNYWRVMADPIIVEQKLQDLDRKIQKLLAEAQEIKSLHERAPSAIHDLELKLKGLELKKQKTEVDPIVAKIEKLKKQIAALEAEAEVGND